MPIGGESGVWLSSEGTAAATKPKGARGAIAGTTTMWAQQHRHPSPEQPSSASLVVCVEKRQIGEETRPQAKISVAARSSSRSVTTRRTVDQCAMIDISL